MEVKSFLDGKKTYFVVAALIVLNALTADNPVSVEGLQDTLVLSLGATFRSAFNKLVK